MITITDRALGLIPKNNRIIGRLMIAFDRGQNTIENWIESKDVRLTTPMAVLIIAEETGLKESEILEESAEVVKSGG